MIELPEALTVASQVRETVVGKKIAGVIAAHSPHKFAWYHGDPQNYPDLLVGKVIDDAHGYGGMVEIQAGRAMILVNDGVGLRFHEADHTRPAKHQLLIEFEDGSALSSSVQMYGGLLCFIEGELENHYYTVAKEKPSPVSEHFDRGYFDRMISSPDVQKFSAKAFLATEQRIPGLGNGTLQEILWKAGIHPKTKINLLSDELRGLMFDAVKQTLGKMIELGGRDTEKDLFGSIGGYKTVMSKTGLGSPCPICSGVIKKENYLGGSIYFCENCQPIHNK